ncbi:tRNA pseudouridine(55) synthase TruB [Anaerocolumna sp. AGMB13020]|uniref:tRNA pseudouridine(55) synthase TruB n=1 Tax=Anaerocolumna sp. AGMB13020 TaxID=3081750 RepID=UPI00295570F5|nr:tRNA pseudouridine(55) synthase TruB [Anaerocolumna sp. AGMB13020]WOO36622.1 tRNA pseudouridine(55) synthase TruB [Anaerocolumna sp. AGMB13020]
MINGIINVYKEKGYTSHDVVAKLRGILKQKKIGHTGTLDPDAEGVLPVCLGNATKLCDILTDRSKTYQAVLLLGTTTDTQDITGTVLSERTVTAEKEEIRKAILSFQGSYDQIPPMYSALKIGGKRLYELAREGKEVPREARKVEIHSIEIEELDILTGQVTVTVDCSKGTYIRTLCHDIGEKLGCGGCMKSLLRTRAGEFHISKSLKINEIADKINEGNLDEHIKKADEMFAGYPSVNVKQEFEKQLYNGNFLSADQIMQEDINIFAERIRVYDWQGNFVGLYEGRPEERIMKPYKMFL